MEGRLIKGQIGVIGGAECSPEIYEIARPEVALTKSMRDHLVGIKTWDLEGRVPMAEGGRTSITMLLDMLR